MSEQPLTYEGVLELIRKTNREIRGIARRQKETDRQMKEQAAEFDRKMQEQ